MGKTEIKCARCAQKEKEKKQDKNGLKLLLAITGLTAGLLGFLMSIVTLIVGSLVKEPLWLGSSVQYTAVMAILLEYILIVYGGSELVKWKRL